MVPLFSKAIVGDKPKLLEQVRHLLGSQHSSIRTEEAYAAWIRRYVLFHGKQHPREPGEPAPLLYQFPERLFADENKDAGGQRHKVQEENRRSEI